MATMDILFLILLFTVAFLYSSVGHGGGSGYLALFALFGVATTLMKPTALTLNVFVSAIAFLVYTKGGYFRWRLIFPFLITSIPSAYLGALIHVDPKIYKIVLGIFLLIAIFRMLFVPGSVTEAKGKPQLPLALGIGLVLGFFSGMIGIGGGIILSPILILFHWASLKESAAASALFIFLNSIAGLLAMFQTGFSYSQDLLLWIIIGVAGGVMGSYSGSFRLKSSGLKYLLAAVLLLASLKLFIY
jgi:uncharacterized protein